MQGDRFMGAERIENSGLQKRSATRLAAGWLVPGLCLMLIAGCGEQESKQDDEAGDDKGPKQVVTGNSETVTSETATEKARAAVEEAGKSVREAATAVTEQVNEKTSAAKEELTRITAETVEKAAVKVGEVAKAVEAAATPDTQAAEKIYQSLCYSCHDFGVAGAPKPGDKPAWEGRIGQGKDSLYASVINGKGAMPPRGGNATLSDDEIRAVVDYMLEK